MPTQLLGDADLQAIIDGLGGVPVVVGGTSARGLLRVNDRPPVAVEDAVGSLQQTQRSVLVRTATFGDVAAGTAITVDGVAYKVTNSDKLGTGIWTRIYLGHS